MSKVKSFKSYVLAIIFLFTAVVSGWSPVMAASDTTSDFKQLNSKELVYDMGAGWNLGNQLECCDKDGIPSETAWGNPTITKPLIQKVKAAGFKTIRVTISYLNKIGSAPNYTIDPAWLDRIKEVVDYAYNEGLYVIINMHGDGYKNFSGSWLLCDSPDQAPIRDELGKVWTQIASKFANYNQHLIFESMNEEFNGSYGKPDPTCYANINAYNQIFVDTVRQLGGNNSSRWLLIPGWNTNIDNTAGDFGFVIPTDNYRSSAIPSSEKRIMISVHYYSPWEFCGDTSGKVTQWGATSTDNSKKATWGQEDYLTAQLKLMYDKFASQGYPVVIGEFGSIDKTKDDPTNGTYREIFAKTFSSTSKTYGAVPVVWDNGANGDYGFGLFDRAKCTVTQQGIIDAIMSGIGQNVTVLKGDVNGDGEISMADCIALKRHLSSSDYKINEKNSDVNEDGQVDVSDLLDLYDLV
jgi:endoglucanase